VDVSGRAKSDESIRAELVARVRLRRAELEQAVFARVCDGARSPAGGEDAEYLAGLRTAVAAAIDHGLAGVESGEEAAGSAPPEAIAQARRAARAGVSLDTVLRRYVLGSTLLSDFLMQEADHSDFAGRPTVLRDVMSTQAALLEGLMTSITSEYTSEIARLERSPEQRRAARVQRLLAGGSAGTAELGYELDDWHVAIIARGVEAVDSLRSVATALGSRLLCVRNGEDAAWGWLGGQRAVAVRDIERVLSHELGAALSLAVGEPAAGLEGWRLTHRQAQAAFRVALQSLRPFTRYADVALLASVMQDAALAGSLVEIYLSPLGNPDNGGAVLRQTLRAYFAAERNASSAASALGVTRHTVENRLRTVEEKLGQALRTRQAELEVALRLEELEEVPVLLEGAGEG
jgi:hypothetical protein